MTTNLYQIIYKSDSNPCLDINSLIEFKIKIQEKNYKKQVTGLLLFNGRQFLEVLEGTKSELERLYAIIISDERHENVTLLAMEPIPSREFEQWSMQLVISETEDLVEMMEAPEMLGELLHVGEERESASVVLSNYYPQKESLGRSPHIIMSFLERAWESPENFQPSINASKKPIKIDCVNRQLEDRYLHQFAFQPIIDIDNCSISSLEALLRGKNGESPENMFRCLTDSQRHRLDVDSKHSAVSMFAYFGCSNTSLSINLLPTSLVSFPEIVQELRLQAESLSIEPSRITIEITEQEIVKNHDAFISIVNQIRGSGMRLSIDDFGAGYAGMSLLADFQPHKIKIDRKIIDGIAYNGPRQSIVTAIMQLSSSMGIEVIAEGIENFNDFSWLKSVGVKYFQGFYFARPGYMKIPDVTF